MKKIDKDVMRITDTSIDITLLEVSKPEKEDE